MSSLVLFLIATMILLEQGLYLWIISILVSPSTPVTLEVSVSTLIFKGHRVQAIPCNLCIVSQGTVSSRLCSYKMTLFFYALSLFCQRPHTWGRTSLILKLKEVNVSFLSQVAHLFSPIFLCSLMGGMLLKWQRLALLLGRAAVPKGLSSSSIFSI